MIFKKHFQEILSGSITRKYYQEILPGNITRKYYQEILPEISARNFIIKYPEKYIQETCIHFSASS
ncbi:hypothetical protein ASJ81_19890 [Methanosarcina spelaei]|uniref:Uncharacterized protein n=1 Tax=Methanosarcina spelaei TaxID=1036679 RepID=A0A2A2HT69_9EURY|nr:hypothetical protein ASJ81_19890 [Methanosarcina spelaei]